MYLLYMCLIVCCNYKTMPFYAALHDVHNTKYGSSRELNNDFLWHFVCTLCRYLPPDVRGNENLGYRIFRQQCSGRITF